MSTLADDAIRAATRQRIAGLTPQSRRQWGRMTPHQMLCHLSDALLLADGSRSAKSIDNIFSRSVVRYVALHTSMTWPHGAKTVPEADQERNGTPPAEWQRDHNELLALFDAFIAHDGNRHPFFGPLSITEWNVWAYRHIDHHLRQFSA